MRKLNFRIGRPAETSRTIAQDLQELEKKQESDRNTYTVTYERLKDSLLTSGKSDEKRAKKLKEYELGSAIGELATAASQVHSQLVLGLQASSTPTPRGTQPQSLSKDAQSGAIKREHRNLEDFATILQRFGDVQMQLAKQRVQFESVSVETNILPKLLRIIEEDVPALQKQKKALAKMESEFDSLKTRLATADEKLLREQRASGNTTNASAANYDSHGSSLNVGQNNAGSGTESSAGGSTLKAEQLASLVSKLRDEVDDANAKLEAAREVYALDLYAFDAKTSDRAGLFVAYLESQHAYYAACAATIDNALAPLRVTVDDLKRFPVYGTSLQDHLLATRREIAYPLQFCAEGLITLDALNEEGLFRIAGGHAKLRNLKRSFDVGRSIDIADFAADVHALTGAIKQYLRELEEPLLTFSLYDSWVAAIGESGEAGRAALKACVDSLPQANYRNLAYLFQFLQLVVRHAETNRMSANNLAICVGPNLLWSPDESSAGARTQQPVALDFAANSNQVCAMIAESLINHYDYYFPKCIYLKQFESQLKRVRLMSKQKNGAGRNLMTESFYAHSNSSSSSTTNRNVRAKSVQQIAPVQSSSSSSTVIYNDSFATVKKKTRGKLFNMHVPSLRLGAAPSSDKDSAGVDGTGSRPKVRSPLVLFTERNRAPPLATLNCGDGRSQREPESSKTVPETRAGNNSSATGMQLVDHRDSSCASDNEADHEHKAIGYRKLERDRPLAKSSISVANVPATSRKMLDWSLQPASSVDRDEPFWRERRKGMLSAKSVTMTLTEHEMKKGRDQPSLGLSQCQSFSVSTRTLPHSGAGVVLKTLAEAEAALGFSLPSHANSVGSKLFLCGSNNNLDNSNANMGIVIRIFFLRVIH